MREALALAARLDYDVVFCDISMPELTGIDAARELASWPTSPLVVFVTAHQDYAVQAYSVDGFDYLLKPVSEERLARTVARLQAARRGQPARQRRPGADQGAGRRGAARRCCSIPTTSSGRRRTATPRASRRTTRCCRRASRCASSRTCCPRRGSSASTAGTSSTCSAWCGSSSPSRDAGSCT